MGINLGMQLLKVAKSLLVELELRTLLVRVQKLFNVGQSGPYDIPHRQIHCHGQGLRELADDEVAAAYDLTMIMFQLTGDQLQRRRFSGAISADQAHPFARLYRQVGFAQDGVFAKRQRDFVESD